MNEPDFLLIDRQYLRNMAAQLKYAHSRLTDHCPCEFCAHGHRMGLPVQELPQA